jgi:hypothetical protein
MPGEAVILFPTRYPDQLGAARMRPSPYSASAASRPRPGSLPKTDTERALGVLRARARGAVGWTRRDRAWSSGQGEKEGRHAVRKHRPHRLARVVEYMPGAFDATTGMPQGGADAADEALQRVLPRAVDGLRSVER